MAMNLRKQIAGSRLLVSFYRTEDIDQVRLLRAAGLVVALVPSPSNALTLSGSASAAQVLAITQKEREELAKFSYPESRPARWLQWPSRLFARHRANTGEGAQPMRSQGLPQ